MSCGNRLGSTSTGSAETARIELDLGELIVTRRFTPAGSHVIVEAASGARFRAPQHMLDQLIGCWVEVTDDDADHKGKTGIIIEDGAVRQPAPPKPEPQAALALL